MEESDKKTCVNCRSKPLGEYCQVCGQHQTIRPLTWKELIYELSSKWFGWDNKFLRTIKFLTINPGKVGRDYLEGNRVRYIGPLAYLFLVTTIMVLSFQIFNVDITEFLKQNTEILSSIQEDQTERQKQFSHDVTQMMGENFRMITSAMIPFMAFWALILYKKQGYNFIQHCVNFIYINGHAVWLTIISIIVFKATGSSLTVAASIISIGYSIYGVITFYQIKQKIIGIFKALLLWFLGYLTFMLFMFILMGLYVAFFMDIIE